MHLSTSIIVLVLAVVVNVLVSYTMGGRFSTYGSPPFSEDDIPDLTGKYVIVTGANSGIGRVTARGLAGKGAYVIATTRSESKGEEALQEMLAESGGTMLGKVEFQLLDLSSFRSIGEFARRNIARGISIDILVLNAGIMFVPYSETEDGFESQFGVNHLGHFLLVKLLLESMNRGGRIVHVSSAAHWFPYFSEGVRFNQLDSSEGYNPVQAYGQSKLANILFSNALSRRLEGSGITSNAVHPGIINTNLFLHLDPLATTSSKLVKKMRYYLLNYGLLLMDVNVGAKTQIYASTSPQVAGVTGQYFSPIGHNATISSFASDIRLQERLWDVSEKMVAPFVDSLNV